MSRSPFYLVVDQGGHASRAIVHDAQAKVIARSEVAIQTRRPAPGWVEHDAEAVLASVEQAILSVITASQIQATRLRSLALSCQRASVLAWRRRSGVALTPVLSWQDTRAADLLDARLPNLNQVSGITGVRPNAHFGASKLRWLGDHSISVRQALDVDDLAWGPLASFLLQRLANSRPYFASHSIAQRTLLFDIHRADWSPILCAAFSIPPAGLPACVADLTEHGVFDRFGLRLPIRLVAGDQNLLPAALGVRWGAAGVLNLGTGAFVLLPSQGECSTDGGLLRSVIPGSDTPPDWAWEGTINGAGAAFEWLAATQGATATDWSRLTAPGLTERSALFLNRVGGLGSPFWQPDSRADFDHPPEDSDEAGWAVAESIGFLLRANLDALRRQCRAPHSLWVGGGLARSRGLCQLLADISGCELQVAADHELSARGATALLAKDDSDAELAPPVATFHCTPVTGAGLYDARYLRWLDRLAGEST